jgi:hypothetical protein
MIKVYPTKIEAIDECGSCVFTIESFDEYTGILTIDRCFSESDLDELFDAIKEGFISLKLDKGEEH